MLMDLDTLNEWSWGGMTLAWLYDQLSHVTDPTSGAVGGYMTLLEGWILAHFRSMYTRKLNPDYHVDLPLAARWSPSMGHADPAHYRVLIDLMVNADVTWRPYEDRRNIMPFQDICWYSGWIMAGKATVCIHLPERVLKQYRHVQIVPRSSTDFQAL